jgi:DNA-binding response OmpR family regulator
MGYKILLVEDDPEQSKPFAQLLLYRGHQVDHAANGIDGVAKALKYDPDLVIIDLLLVQRGDEMDGFELIQALRDTPETARVAIIAWTGHFVDPRDAIRALRVGADDYVNKDIEFGLMEARIEALLRRVGWRTEARG